MVASCFSFVARRPRALPIVLLCLLVSAAGACGGEDSAPDGATDGSTVETPESASGQGEDAVPAPTEVPEGGLEQWVTDIRRGLEDVELNPRDSQDEVEELYRQRQEPIEAFYGAGGEITGDDYPSLADAVAEQDARFQDLMELTGTTLQIQRERILGAVQELRLALNRTLEIARETDLPLDRGPE